MTYYNIIYKTVTVRSTNPTVQFFMGLIATDSWGLTQTVTRKQQGMMEYE